jgi:hypothetical protein
MGLGLSRMTSYNLLFKENTTKGTKKKAQRCAFGKKPASETSLNRISEQYMIEETLRELSNIPAEFNLEIIKVNVFDHCWLNRGEEKTQACKLEDDVSIRYEVLKENCLKKGRWWGRVKNFFSFTYDDKTFEYAIITWWLHKDGDTIDLEGDVDLDFGIPQLREGDIYDLVRLDSLKELEQMIPVFEPQMFKKKGFVDQFELYYPSTSALFLPPFPICLTHE